MCQALNTFPTFLPIQCISRGASEEVGELKRKYHCKTLKQLVQATDLFNLQDEHTDKGGTRTVYRHKPGWQIEKT